MDGTFLRFSSFFTQDPSKYCKHLQAIYAAIEWLVPVKCAKDQLATSLPNGASPSVCNSEFMYALWNVESCGSCLSVCSCREVLRPSLLPPPMQSLPVLQRALYRPAPKILRINDIFDKGKFRQCHECHARKSEKPTSVTLAIAVWFCLTRWQGLDSWKFNPMQHFLQAAGHTCSHCTHSDLHFGPTGWARFRPSSTSDMLRYASLSLKLQCLSQFLLLEHSSECEGYLYLTRRCGFPQPIQSMLPPYLHHPKVHVIENQNVGCHVVALEVLRCDQKDIPSRLGMEGHE